MFKSQVSFVLLFSLLGITLSYKISTITKEGIPDGLKTEPFQKIGKVLYYIETKLKVNWYQANERCHAMDAKLISFETWDEWELVNGFLVDNKIEDLYWSSANDLAEQSRHVWFTTGQPVWSKHFWAPEQPSNNNNERCDEMGYKAKPHRLPGLKNIPCSTLLRFICEKRQLTTVSFVVW